MSQTHLDANRDHWNADAANWVEAGEQAWASTPDWGVWALPEADLRLLPDDMAGMAAIELGCGTGYVSAWMDARGADVTGIDLSREQLATARRLAGEHGRDITWIEGNAEDVPCADARFDFAISEYGAAIWCNPDLWIPEAHRLLKKGGGLVFLGAHPLTILASPLNGADLDRGLHRPYRGMNKTDWTQVEIEPGGIEFNRTFQGWLDLFRATGFKIEDYQELYAPEGISGTRFSYPADWSRDYPTEQVWKLRKL